MKYQVQRNATLSFADGSHHTLKAGIHELDSFPEAVKKHWAFAHHAAPLDPADFEKEQASKDLIKHAAELSTQVADRDETITALLAEIDALKAQIAAMGGADKPDGKGKGNKAPVNEGNSDGEKQQSAD